MQVWIYGRLLITAVLPVWLSLHLLHDFERLIYIKLPCSVCYMACNCIYSKTIMSVCLYDICKFTFNLTCWSISCFFLHPLRGGRHEPTVITRLLASRHSQLHAKGGERRDPLTHGQAADEVVCPLSSHWSVLCKMKGWSAVCWSVAIAVSEPGARRQTH